MIKNVNEFKDLIEKYSKIYFHLQERIKLMREYLIEYEEWEKNNGK